MSKSTCLRLNEQRDSGGCDDTRGEKAEARSLRQRASDASESTAPNPEKDVDVQSFRGYLEHSRNHSPSGGQRGERLHRLQAYDSRAGFSGADIQSDVVGRIPWIFPSKHERSP